MIINAADISAARQIPDIRITEFDQVKLFKNVIDSPFDE